MIGVKLTFLPVQDDPSCLQTELPHMPYLLRKALQETVVFGPSEVPNSIRFYSQEEYQFLLAAIRASRWPEIIRHISLMTQPSSGLLGDQLCIPRIQAHQAAITNDAWLVLTDNNQLLLTTHPDLINQLI